MKFNYGDTLRIRNELYTILGKIRYIDTHRRIWYKYKLVKHKNNAEFWISWNEKHDVYQFTKLCGKVIPSDMNDKMDTVKKVRFIGPIIWILANLLKNK